MAQPSTWSRLLNTLQFRRDYHHLPAGLSWRSNTFFIVSTIGIGMFTDLFLYGLIVPILPFMLRDRIGVPESQIQSYVSMLLALFAGASVLCSPFVGYLSDRLSSRQSMFVFGLVLMIFATVLLFTGDSIPVLVIARMLQGVSGAFVWTIGLALCLETVGPDKLGTTVGSIFSFIGVGNFAAPILGGLLYEKVGINGVFGLGIALLAVDLGMRVLVIEKKIASEYYTACPDSFSETNTSPSRTDDSDEENQHTEDTAPEPTETQPLLRTITEPDSHYILPPTTSALLNIFPFYRCLSDPRLLTALFITLVQALLFGAFDATIPLIAHSYFNFTSLRAGLLFVPLGAFDLILGPVFGWCVDRYGTKPIAVLTYAFLVPVLLCLRIPHPGGADQIALYAVLLALAGAGLSGTGAPSIVEAGAIAERYYKANKDVFGERGPYAQLYGMTNMVFSLGLTIGPELAGELKQRIGYGNMNAVLAAICAVTSVLSWVYIGGRTRVIFGKREGE